MALRVYSTLSRKIEDFKTLRPNEVKMYCCGPTVYDFLHVGNFRGAIFYNFVRNWLEYLGYKVTYVYNFTDVDDKIIDRAKKEGKTSLEISEHFIEEFKKDFASLKLKGHSANPKVTEFIPQIVDFVKSLVEKNNAYIVNGEVLYSIKAFPEYGKLSGRKPEENIAGMRVEIDEKKENPMDFALWKPSKPGEPAWPSPWGEGRPGWHIECSAMVRSLLGDEIDIHGGGADLIFPHHENEIAQSEGCTGHPLARYWIHNNLLTFGGQKMSKSLGNIMKMRDFIGEYHPEIYKYMVMSVHYRSLMEFSDITIDNAIAGLARVYSALSLADSYMDDLTVTSGEDPKFKAELEKLWLQIEESFNDDFSTSQGFAKVFDAVRLFNGQVKRGLKNSPVIKAKSKLFMEFILRFGGLMSLFQENPGVFLRSLDNRLLEKLGKKREEIDQIVSLRTQARAVKDFKKSDELRDQLVSMGIAIADTPEGTFWEVAK